MAFLDELSNKLTGVVKKIGEKSDELVGLGKLNYEIYKEEDAVKKLYSQIGQVVYQAYSQESNSINVIYDLCKEIDSRRERIEALKREAEDIKAGKKAGGSIFEAVTESNEAVEKQQEETKQAQPESLQEERAQPVNQEQQSKQVRQEEQ